MPQEDFKRKLAAILSADVKEYSRLMRYRKLNDKIKVLTQEKRAKPEEIDKPFEGEQTKKRSRHDIRAKRRLKKHLMANRRFRRHLLTYVGVIGFLFIVNMLTWHGTIWFHWPTLGWGLLIFLHWIKYSHTSSG